MKEEDLDGDLKLIHDRIKNDFRPPETATRADAKAKAQVYLIQAIRNLHKWTFILTIALIVLTLTLVFLEIIPLLSKRF